MCGKPNKQLTAYLLLGLAIVIVPWSTFPLELLSHFRWQYAMFSFALTVFFLLCRELRRGLLAALVFGCHLWPLLPYYTPNDQATLRVTPPTKTIHVLFANLHWKNDRDSDLIELIHKIDVDVLSFSELTPAFLAKLESLNTSYPFRSVYPVALPSGPAFFSKFPITREAFEPSTVRLEAEMAVEHKQVIFFNVATPPPLSPQQFAARERVVQLLGERLVNETTRSIIVGDFNSSPWSPFFMSFTRKYDLKDSRLGHGILATWPAQIAPLRIPIDYCLVKKGTLVRQAKVVSIPGSDHRGMLCSIDI